MASRQYFTKRAKALAKQIEDEKTRKENIWKPKPKVPFRPITGQRTMALKIKIKKVRPKKWIPHYRRRERTIILVAAWAKDKKMWKEAAYQLGMPLSGLLRLAMMYFLGSNRFLRQVAKGNPYAFTMRHVSQKTMNRRILKAFGLHPDSEGVGERAEDELTNQKRPSTGGDAERVAGSSGAGRSDRNVSSRDRLDLSSADVSRDHTSQDGGGRTSEQKPKKTRLMIPPP